MSCLVSGEGRCELIGVASGDGGWELTGYLNITRFHIANFGHMQGIDPNS